MSAESHGPEVERVLMHSPLASATVPCYSKLYFWSVLSCTSRSLNCSSATGGGESRDRASTQENVCFPEPAPRLRRADSGAQGAGAGDKPVQPASQAQAACQAAREDLGTGGHRRHTEPRAAPRQALHARAVHTRAQSRGDAVPDALFTGRPAGLRHTRRHAPGPTREQAAARTLTLTLESTASRRRAR